MYWADLLAEEIIQRNPDKEEYVCAAGISPSGSIHIGNFRDIATSYLVALALRRKGRKARLLFSWDNFDRFRKVPANVISVVGNDAYDQYIGMPYVDIPDPFGTDSNYAVHFQNEFLNSFKAFGIEMEFRSQADEYRRGSYSDNIIFALKHRYQIFDILARHRTQESSDEERNNYYPVSIYCPKCHRDTTHVTSLSENCDAATYTCDCGYAGEIHFKTDFNCKLPWKVDWPMRWRHEGVDFEPGGKDHASLHGSYDAAKDVSIEVFGYRPPLFQGYEFIGIKGNISVGKMSGSSGLNMTPEFLLKLYQPELILWLYAKTEPMKAFDFCLSDEILRQYYEYDKMLNSYRSGGASENIVRIMESCEVKGREIVTVPMSQLVELGAVVDFNADMMEALFEKIGTPFPRDCFIERLQIAKFWLRTCAPENEYIINSVRNWEYYNTLDDQEKKEIELLHEYIACGNYSLDGLKDILYAIPKQVYTQYAGDVNALKPYQSAFFKHIYNLIISRDKGPRLYLYLFAVEASRYIKLLDFSVSMDKDIEYQTYLATKTMEMQDQETKEEIVEERYVESALPVKPLVTLSEFGKMDLRVCKVISCKPIRKTNKLYNMIVHDGIGEREIVSSLAGDYEPEELIGKKVIVLVNLEAHKFGNTISNGMLLAAVNEDGSSNILTVCERAQIGSIIH